MTYNVEEDAIKAIGVLAEARGIAISLNTNYAELRIHRVKDFSQFLDILEKAGYKKCSIAALFVNQDIFEIHYWAE